MEGKIIKHLSDSDFDEIVLKSSLPFVVSFWAPWCGPCKYMSSIIEEISQELKGRVKFGRLNVDSNTKTSKQYKVNVIPTIILFKDGREERRIVGAMPKEQLVQKLGI